MPRRENLWVGLAHDTARYAVNYRDMRLITSGCFEHRSQIARTNRTDDIPESTLCLGESRGVGQSPSMVPFHSRIDGK